MQSIDIKSRPKEKFKENIEVVLTEILKEYDATQRTNCDYIRLYFNNTYSIIIKMLDSFDIEAIAVKMFIFNCENDRCMHVVDTIFMPKESGKEINKTAIKVMADGVMQAYNFLEKGGDISINDDIFISWNLNESVDLDDRLVMLDMNIKEKHMNPKDFACWIGAACKKYNNIHNNKMYIDLDFQIEDEEEQIFTNIITIDELTVGGLAYTLEYCFPSLKTEKRREVRTWRSYSIEQLTNSLSKAFSWYFDLRDVRLPDEKFDFQVSVLSPEFWA